MEIWYDRIVCKVQNRTSLRKLPDLKELSVGKKTKLTSWQNA